MSCAVSFIGGSQDGKTLVVAFPMHQHIVFPREGMTSLEVYRRRRRLDAEGRAEDIYEVEP